MSRRVCIGRGRARAGYTLVELMMALALFTVAILGIISMQKITVISNTHAKDLAIAQRIAQSWAAQLELDATTWQATRANAAWLGNVGLGWQRPAYAEAQAFGAAFDALGNPLADDADGDLARTRYCTHVRLSWLYPDNAPVSGNGLMRAEIRVFWLRDGQSYDAANVQPCQVGQDAALISAATGRYHFIYHTTGLRQHSSI